MQSRKCREGVCSRERERGDHSFCGPRHHAEPPARAPRRPPRDRQAHPHMAGLRAKKRFKNRVTPLFRQAGPVQQGNLLPEVGQMVQSDLGNHSIHIAALGLIG